MYALTPIDLALEFNNVSARAAFLAFMFSIRLASRISSSVGFVNIVREMAKIGNFC